MYDKILLKIKILFWNKITGCQAKKNYSHVAILKHNKKT